MIINLTFALTHHKLQEDHRKSPSKKDNKFDI